MGSTGSNSTCDSGPCRMSGKLERLKLIRRIKSAGILYFVGEFPTQAHRLQVFKAADTT